MLLSAMILAAAPVARAGDVLALAPTTGGRGAAKPVWRARKRRSARALGTQSLTSLWTPMGRRIKCLAKRQAPFKLLTKAWRKSKTRLGDLASWLALLESKKVGASLAALAAAAVITHGADSFGYVERWRGQLPFAVEMDHEVQTEFEAERFIETCWVAFHVWGRPYRAEQGQHWKQVDVDPATSKLTGQVDITVPGEKPPRMTYSLRLKYEDGETVETARMPFETARMKQSGHAQPPTAELPSEIRRLVRVHRVDPTLPFGDDPDREGRDAYFNNDELQIFEYPLSDIGPRAIAAVAIFLAQPEPSDAFGEYPMPRPVHFAFVKRKAGPDGMPVEQPYEWMEPFVPMRRHSPWVIYDLSRHGLVPEKWEQDLSLRVRIPKSDLEGEHPIGLVDVAILEPKFLPIQELERTVSQADTQVLVDHTNNTLELLTRTGKESVPIGFEWFVKPNGQGGYQRWAAPARARQPVTISLEWRGATGAGPGSAWFEFGSQDLAVHGSSRIEYPDSIVPFLDNAGHILSGNRTHILPLHYRAVGAIVDFFGNPAAGLDKPHEFHVWEFGMFPRNAALCDELRAILEEHALRE